MRPLHSTTAFALTITLFGTERWNDVPRGMRKTVLVAHKPVCVWNKENGGMHHWSGLARPGAMSMLAASASIRPRSCWSEYCARRSGAKGEIAGMASQTTDQRHGTVSPRTSWARPDPQGDFYALDDPYSSCSRSVFLCRHGPIH